MMVFPNPLKAKQICTKEEVILFTECYCQNGHSLISSNAKFNELNGIFLKISKDGENGFVALSPVYGCKTRVAVGIELKEGEKYTLLCPVCNEPLHVFSKCHCKGNIFTLFLNKRAMFNSFLGACNRIGCENSFIQIGEKLINSARQEAY